MPPKYAVEITAAAEADLHRILEFIAQDAPETAQAWLLEAERHILTLESLPLRCAVVPEAADLGVPYRHLVLGNYRVVFRIDRRTVWVLRVVHGAQLLETSILDSD